MTESAFLLALSYAFVTFLLLLIVTRARLSIKIRAITAISGAAFYIAHFLSLNGLGGWPATLTLPEEFQLHAFTIVEPNSIQNESGHIYVWIQETGDAEPRAYSLPYSSSVHDQLTASEKRRQGGYQQKGRSDGSGTIKISNASRRLPQKVSLDN